MNQTMALTPFELLARQWRCPAALCGAVFDASAKAVAFHNVDGQVALAPLADAEDTPSRLRLELETGRAVIRPRTSDPAPLAETGVAATAIAALADFGFLVADATGALSRLTPRGQLVRLAAPRGPVVALAVDVAGRMALAREAEVEILDAAGESLSRDEVDGACGLSFRDGCLAIARRGALTLLEGPNRIDVAIADPAGAPVLEPKARWAAGRSAAGGMWLTETGTGRTAHLTDFPVPPSVAFDVQGRLVASGAFRLAAWDLLHPPLAGETAGALRTGRAGFVAVSAAAPHPGRDVVAVGRANGELSLARIGQPDEMVVRPGDGDPIDVLVWAPDGRRLAVGTRGGLAALVDFPAQMFK